MKTLGIVGGIAPPSTIQYYRSIVEIHRNRAHRPPHVLINSVDGDVVLGHLMAGRQTDLVAALLEAVQQLASAGAELALLASISVHIVFDDVCAATPLPLIDIVEATADAVVDFKRLGLFATRFTMQADLFGPALRSRGISTVAPSADEQETIDRVYFDELVAGRFLPASRDRLLAIGARLRVEEEIDGILLGGTELPLLLPMGSHDGLVYLDVSRIHADAAVTAMLA
jgi:aspartate racemase